MSIILKGIDLPGEGESIHVLITSNGNFGIVSNKNVDIGFRKAIQIPKGHGRLIDANKIFTYNHWEEQAVNEAPIILEAEE